jgi:antitoxin PrlF
MSVQAKVTSKGQITLPKEVRDRYGIKPGDSVEFIEEAGRTWMRARNVRAVDLAGILHRPGMTPLTVKEMDEAIMDAVAEDDGRIVREWRQGPK